MRVVNEIRPWYIVMENVPGIITMKKGAVKKEICQAFIDIGYSNVSLAILESAAYGVPQIRPRTFLLLINLVILILIQNLNYCLTNINQLSQQFLTFQN